MQDFRMETFLTVCEYMNFTKAANVLGLTQPAVSQQIHFLEQEYGVQLFTLKGRRIQLTEAGKMLESAALTMKHDEIHLKNKMQQASQSAREYIFGATLTVADYILSPRLVDFQKQHPQSRLHMQVKNTAELLHKIDSGELDFAIVEGYFPKEDYEYLLFRTEDYIPVCSGASSRKYDGCSLSDLTNEVLITRERGSGTREILEKILAKHNMDIYDFKSVSEIGSISVIKQLTAAECGITFLYKAAVQQEIRKGILQPVLPEGWNYTHDIMFIFRKGSIFKEDYRQIFNAIAERSVKNHE